MALRVITSVSKLCSKLQKVSIATSCKHGYSSLVSTHTAGIHPSVYVGVVPGTQINKETMSDTNSSRGLEYKCPSQRRIKAAILDIPDRRVVSYDCPYTSVVDKEFVLPATHSPSHIEMPSTDTAEISKQAKNILKIRHRMRKKHALRKRKKLITSTMKKFYRQRLKTKQKECDDVVNVIRTKGVDFDADEFLNSILRQAQRGGYRLALFDKKKQC